MARGTRTETAESEKECKTENSENENKVTCEEEEEQRGNRDHYKMQSSVSQFWFCEANTLLIINTSKSYKN